nr:MAG TPA: hypothetical protein [Bacteriophage sp.]DAU98930.1 MAG TPA: hypothetical protein [Bacteriophage sp.]DAZ41510.1 MAG TPA: hypothetical protein [Caudoviricetes sp.]
MPLKRPKYEVGVWSCCQSPSAYKPKTHRAVRWLLTGFP